jgi:pimeloyl-ACP methyl ester carboxylesterase
MRLLFQGISALTICLVPLLVHAQDLPDRFFDSNGVRIRYVDQGTGQPIVLLHGQGNNVDAAWIRTGVVANLAKDHRVIAMDLRGHGKSGKPHDPEAYGEEMGRDVLRLLDHLQIRRAHILGYSMGGAVNAKLLTTHPERYLTAILGGSSGRRDWSAELAKAAEDEAAEWAQGPPFRAFISRNTPPDQPPPTEEQMRATSQRMLETIDPLAMAAYMRSRHRQVVTNAELAALRVPVLAVVGSADPALAGVNELKAAMPRLKVVVIDGATQSSATERGAPRRPEFVNAIREFVATHKLP